MSQYPRSAATTSDGGYYNNNGDVSRGPSSASTAGFAGRGAAAAAPQPMTTMPEASAYVNSGYSANQFGPAAGAAAGGVALGAGAAAATAGMSAKQREAYQERQRQYQATQPSSSGSGPYGSSSDPTSPVTEGGRQTVVSQDAGPAGEDEPYQAGGEIPPT